MPGWNGTEPFESRQRHSFSGYELAVISLAKLSRFLSVRICCVFPIGRVVGGRWSFCCRSTCLSSVEVIQNMNNVWSGLVKLKWASLTSALCAVVFFLFCMTRLWSYFSIPFSTWDARRIISPSICSVILPPLYPSPQPTGLSEALPDPIHWYHSHPGSPSCCFTAPLIFVPH